MRLVWPEWDEQNERLYRPYMLALFFFNCSPIVTNPASKVEMAPQAHAVSPEVLPDPMSTNSAGACGWSAIV